MLSREALGATLFARAETLAQQLHPDEASLVPMWLRQHQAECLLQQARADGVSNAEAQNLFEESWKLTQSVLAVVERRTAAGTTVRSVITSVGLAHPCFIRHRSTARAAKMRCCSTGVGYWLHGGQATGPLSPSVELNTLSPAVGYVLTLLVTPNTCPALFDVVPLAANERQRAEAFVLSTVDSRLDIARTFPRQSFTKEKRCVAMIEAVLAEPQHSQFLTALRARWTAAPFQAILRARGLSNAQAAINESDERFRVRQRADIAAHGLHPCGLPSCDKRETTVKQFKYCGDCEEEWYCCAEHQVLHWKEHKPICRARTAAAAAGASE